MAVTRWRPLDDYHPAVRLMVRYMWRQEPPLLPSGFADQMGLPRQLVSRWLQIQAPEIRMDIAMDTAVDTTAEALPSLTPPLATRLARAMGVAPLEFFVAAGMCTYEEPLFAVEDAWEYVVARVTSRLAQHRANDADNADASLDGAADVRQALEEARRADLGQGTTRVIPADPEVCGKTTDLPAGSAGSSNRD